jgi:quercetin dioxygenase-like cupin family protein
MRSTAAAILVLTLLGTSGASAQLAPTSAPAPIVVKPLASATTTASGQPIVFPQGPGRVVVSEYVISPGAALPLHQHPHPRVAYVLQGMLEVTDKDTAQVFSYSPGQVVMEVIGQRHLGRNKGDDAVRLIVFDTIPEDAQGNVVLIEE